MIEVKEETGLFTIEIKTIMDLQIYRWLIPDQEAEVTQRIKGDHGALDKDKNKGEVERE